MCGPVNSAHSVYIKRGITKNALEQQLIIGGRPALSGSIFSYPDVVWSSLQRSDDDDGGQRQMEKICN